MSISTIFVQRPLSYCQSLATLRRKCQDYSPVLTTFLWAFCNIYSIARTHFNHNISGITLSFITHEFLVMGAASVLLQLGLSKRKIWFLLPWIAVTVYSLYSNHYLTLLTGFKTLRPVKKLSWLPWAYLSANIVMLVLRVTLLVRVVQLCIHLWFKRKLNELKAKEF